MRTLLWNVEWGKPACLSHFNQIVADEPFDLICLTEATSKFLDGNAHVLRSDGDYGYLKPGRHKVCLWSRFGWSDVDLKGPKALPPGRFLSGVTEGIRVIGVCIPWREAHVRSGRKDRRPWEDHLRYLAVLRDIIRQYVRDEMPIVVLGDFNQRVPPTKRNQEVYSELELALGAELTIHTADLVDADGKRLIDHVASTREFRFNCETTFSRSDGRGNQRSDHPGIIGRLCR